ncbi:MAG: hypothetical protein WB612_08620, partial [Nitrososphaeraceae archaeon]
RVINHLTSKTGQCAYVTTPDAVLPRSNLLNPDIPIVPMTIRSISLFSAYSIIALTTELPPNITLDSN